MEAYRKVLGQEESFDYDSITLGTDRELGVAYELGHIYGKKYEKGMVPGDETRGKKNREFPGADQEDYLRAREVHKHRDV